MRFCDRRAVVHLTTADRGIARRRVGRAPAGKMDGKISLSRSVCVSVVPEPHREPSVCVRSASVHMSMSRYMHAQHTHDFSMFDQYFVYFLSKQTDRSNPHFFILRRTVHLATSDAHVSQRRRVRLAGGATKRRWHNRRRPSACGPRAERRCSRHLSATWARQTTTLPDVPPDCCNAAARPAALPR